MSAETQRGQRQAKQETENDTAPTISEQTYRKLLDMILARELSDGQVLEERPLAKRLEVSRTPLRMALSRLFGEGLIGRLSNGIYVVNNGRVEDYLHLVAVRRLLEGEAAALAAGNMPADQVAELRTSIAELSKREVPSGTEHWDVDDRLHDLIAESCGNPWLGKMITDVRRRVRMCNVEKIPNRLADTCAEHFEILDALERGDSEGSRAAMQRHIDEVRRGFIKLLNIS